MLFYQILRHANLWSGWSSRLEMAIEFDEYTELYRVQCTDGYSVPNANIIF